jgi:heat shock protein HslJ
MKLRVFFYIPVIFLLTACVAGSDSANNNNEPSATHVSVKDLSKYRYKLIDTNIDALIAPKDRSGKSIPMIVSLNNNIHIKHGCNNMSAKYSINKNIISFGSVLSTKMGCQDALMKREYAISTLMKELYVITQTEHTLRMTSNSGAYLLFSSSLTSEARHGSTPVRMFFEIAQKKEQCFHPMMRSMKCLRVREVKYNANGTQGNIGKWRYMYEPIKGYTHNDKVLSTLRVNRYERTAPMPADVSKYVYVLDMYVKRATVQ